MWDQQKPKQPPCDGNQFAELPQPIDGDIPQWPSADENYYSVRFDQKNNVIADGRYNILPENATAQQGASGSLMFADSDGLKNVNNEYGPEDVQRATTVYVSVDRADRGREF